MKYAIVGAGGQLGQAFLRRLGSRAIGLTHTPCDLTKPDTMRAHLAAVHPDVAINCAAYNLVDHAESDPQAAFAVNAWGARDLAECCRTLGCVFVHYGTNYVFGLDRARRTPWRENDLPGPVGVYGASKLAGEHLVRATCPQHFVIRTCGLYGQVKPGTTRRSFVALMLHLASQGKPIRVVNDQICAPTNTDDLVAATLNLLETKAYGLYQLTSAGECSWYEYARTIFELAGVSADLQGTTSAEFNAAAQRPEYSVMANEAYTQLGLEPIQHWKDALASYLASRECKRPGAALGEARA